MKPTGMIALAALLVLPVQAEMAPEERCRKQGDVAQQAANMRLSDVDKDTAVKTLKRMYDQPGSGVTAQNIQGLTTVAYMAKMQPDKMRDYAIAECEKNILK